MNFALAEAVLELSRSAFSVSPTLPGSHTAIWILLRWSTPPATSEAFDSPLRRRLMVVSLLPKAARKVNGNSAPSKGWSAKADTAASISTAFMCLFFLMEPLVTADHNQHDPSQPVAGKSMKVEAWIMPGAEIRRWR